MRKYSYMTAVLLMLTVIAPLLLTACGKTVGETIDDATITTRVKTSLLNDPDVAGLKIDVDTFKGIVTLSGAVKTPVERDKAIGIAKKTPGVVDVKSTLQVNPS
jgi:hyperosmotically inducible periplasmic protein